MTLDLITHSLRYQVTKGTWGKGQEKRVRKMESIGENVSLTQQVQNQARLESEQESQCEEKAILKQKTFSVTGQS